MKKREYLLTVDEFFHIFHFNKRKRVYKIEKPLQLRLLQTSLKNVDSRFLVSPSKSIFISIPDNDTLTFPNIYSNNGEPVVIGGIYVFYQDVSNEHINVSPDPSKYMILDENIRKLRTEVIESDAFNFLQTHTDGVKKIFRVMFVSKNINYSSSKKKALAFRLGMNFVLLNIYLISSILYDIIKSII